ncbi:hypothetical protein ALC60_12521 [Trachymyrmex zeteki]|uniref:Uncharacterized protein n=1 Tax=Mycetomoellerius zeteki TaxID=64791 RepID=A0A151WLA4_9HYME|nr:hypothetical protein ALC60_12521 [Trachymyrmex zeteki]
MRIRVIFSPVWLHEEALARLPVPLHLGRSVSRLPNCLNSRARVYRVTAHGDQFLRIPPSSLPIYRTTNANVEQGSLTLVIILGWYAEE